jgi:ABC-type antimicrobial peptide transport system permease subunit
LFYLSYLRSELVRRKGRTILTLAGLAIGVALVIVISSLTRGLDRAQKTALDPLSSIGTDLTVTLSPNAPAADGSTGGAAAGGFNGGGGFGGGGFGNGSARQLIQANQSAITDLSKLGKPGTHFVQDFFLPGTQLTFPQSQARQLSSLSGVSAVSTGLVLSGVHQEGTVPKIVAKLKAGGQRLTVTGRVRFQFSAAEQAKVRACIQKLVTAQQASGAGAGTTTTPGGGSRLGGGGAGGGLGAGGAGGGLGGGAGGGGFRGFDRGAFAKCLPPQVRNFQRTITTPEQTIQQIVNPPQTNIKSSSYTIAGIDPSQPDIGLVTPALLASGRFLAANAPHEALLANTYASRQGLKVGSTLDLNKTRFTVVGLVKPPLGGQTADVYIPIRRLQSLASEKGLSNVILVRADGGTSVGSVQKEIQQLYPNAQVASAKDVADQISGSLVNASNLSHRLGIALEILAATAAFLLAVLLTLSSVGKRVRELGTLKALGWTQTLVVRQVVGESVAQGVAGGLLGVALGILGTLAVGAFGVTLSAHTTTGGAFGFGSLARTATDTVTLDAPMSLGILALGFLLALVGGLIAGAAGAFRAARLRPADALRAVE